MIYIRLLKDWCVLVNEKTCLYYTFVVLKNIKVFYTYDLILFLYVDLIDNVAIISYECFLQSL